VIAALASLRAVVAESYGWRKRGRLVAEGTKGAEWSADMRLVAQLVEAEREETARHGALHQKCPNRGTFGANGVSAPEGAER
jgi:hypothetical protein